MKIRILSLAVMLSLRYSQRASAVYLLSVLFFVGCTAHDKRSGNENVTAIRIDWSNVRETFDYAPMVEDSVLVIPLETRDDCLIGEVSKVICRNGRIYVGDAMRQAVCVFDMSGKLVTRICSFGNGPEEYLSVTSFTVHGSGIIIYDSFTRKLFFFDSAGILQKTEDVPDIWGMDMFCIKNKLYLVNDGSSSQRGFYHLFSVNLDKAEEHEAFLPFKDPGNSGWGTESVIAPLKDEALIYTCPFDTLYMVKDGAAYPAYFVDFGRKRLPRQYIGEEGRIALKAAFDGNYVRGCENVVQSEKYIFLRFGDSNEDYTGIYNKETGNLEVAKTAVNSLLGDLPLQKNKFHIEDECLIQYYAISFWNLAFEMEGEAGLDRHRFYSAALRQRIDGFRRMDGAESNPVILIQKLKQ
ncbi:6-bladed beta-propeller [Bacteroides sp. GD17]|uniref:6-bladed beta-propeller n=1 Tax=Bacteroides sp. GD17 TaxID=3139826 RepID=UPI00313B079D